MRTTRSPFPEMPHSVGALMDTAFLRSAVADADGPHAPNGARSSAQPGASLRAVAWVRAAVVRLASRA